MSDTSEIDAAVITKLRGDSTLATLMPDGVFFDVAKPGATRSVVVSQVIHEDEYSLRAKAFEKVLYFVRAVAKGTDGSASASNVKAAAARIDALLHDVTLTITGYRHMQTLRIERVRYTEVDEDTGERWQHRGGRYEVWAAPTI